MSDGTTHPAWERFWSKVDASGDCWEWLDALNMYGYGKFGVDGKDMKAHRFSWELLVGPISIGMQLDHLCRNRSCCNPDHMQETTLAENVLRGYGPAAQNARKTHCPQGHEYSTENTLVRKNGKGRVCRTCGRKRSRDYGRRKRQEQNGA